VVGRGELTDQAWAVIGPLLPPNRRSGGQWADHRRTINGILWRLRTGAPWRDVPERYGPWQTVYDRFVRWRRDGTWGRLVRALERELTEADELDLDALFIDSSIVRATRAAAGGGKRGALRSPRTTPSGALAAASPRSFTWAASATATSSPSP